MGKIKDIDRVNYVIHFFSAGDTDYWLYHENVLDELKKHFGEIDYISDELDFQKYTYYYNMEMGQNVKIKARMISFKNLYSPGFLADAKTITNSLEAKYAVDGKRKINLDIGYIHHMQFVLASTKPWGNRIYLSKGIYAEITLMYVYEQWKAFDHSYQNFKDKEYQDILTEIRNMYLEKRRKWLSGRK
ncbi:protein of unknown function [Marinitoga hydrogenitolerans DSM 16785]|uniref:DUF4416 domain-containing protein n=1 Tax=Marinitoga hydrogenitolerans (strain DSM 16785 / JCM 12826 / AT1271) TaxID=1122195 RepID=A0A1M4SNF2_MARH1|nr:DUF4416 family protein [Marinitoga hydrogenitolerans]SHE33804.1 protein of unknown function [Marinitoga hydrogenitolerans DSM 16785]